MSLNRSGEFDRLCDAMSMEQSSPNGKKIILLGGIFGTGKTTLIKKLEEEIVRLKFADSALRFNFTPDTDFIFDYIDKAQWFLFNSEESEHHFQSDELSFYRNNFVENLNSVHAADETLFKKVVEISSLHKKSALNETDTDEVREDKQELETSLASIIEKKSGRRILLNPNTVATEAFIVDLINTFYPINDYHPTYDTYFLDARPKKIIFTFDNFDRSPEPIIKWLSDYLVNYCFEKNFADYEWYELKNIPEELKITNFFDFKFLVSSRHIDKMWKKHYEMSSIIKLEPLTKEEIGEFVNGSGIYTKESTEEIERITRGIPPALNLWFESRMQEESQLTEKDINNYLHDQFLYYKTVEERELLYCAAFMEYIEPQSLKCFPELKNRINKSYKYLKNKSYVTDVDNKHFVITEPFRSILRNYIKDNQPEKAEYYKSVNEVYNEVKPVIKSLNEKETEVARNLAYFRNFDPANALKDAFQTDFELAEEFVFTHPHWFNSNQHTKTLKDDIKEKLNSYNRLVDGDKYDQKLLMLENIWANYSAALIKRLEEIETELPELREEVSILEKDMQAKKQVFTDIQSGFMVKENELIEIKKSLSVFSPVGYLTLAGINLGIGIIILLVAFFFPNLFETANNHREISTSQEILFVISGIFGIISLAHVGRLMYMRSKKKEISELKKKLIQVEAEKTQMHNKLDDLKVEKENAQKRVIDISETIKKLNIESLECREKLNEGFI